MRGITSNATDGVSPHQAGAAIDFDPNGYYSGFERSSVNRNSPNFDQRYIDSLGKVLDELQGNGFCHLIRERRFKEDEDGVKGYDSCWHVCVSPY